MSLFASLGHSDIWSISGISFASPLNDILDKEAFSLEELLQEDELLQEVKSRNSRLIEFLTRDDILQKILDYIVTTPPVDEGSIAGVDEAGDGKDDLQRYKYPYMSCEIFCCEIPQIMAKFENNEDGSTSAMLTKLFEVLDYEAPLDQYLAGYFEKIVDMLFRKMTRTMMNFVNENENLMERFLRHIDNYSTLQILQRLMLPHIPFNMHSPEPEMTEADDSAKCDWSKYQSTCDTLVDKMLVNKSGDIPAHVCALIVTVLQISPLDAPFFSNLCHKSCLSKLLNAAMTEKEFDEDVGNAALAVLAVLIQRLCESVNPELDYEYGGELGGFGRPPFVASENMKECISGMAACVEPFADTFSAQLLTFTDSSPAGEIKPQCKESFPRLGSRGLNLVKLVEVLVRLDDKAMDKMMCDKGMLTSCVKMMFKYELHSILHLSVQKIILTILECGEERKQTQEHIVNESGILEKIMTSITEAAIPAEDGNSSSVGLRRGPAKLGGSRRPILGHLVAIAEFLMSADMAGDEDKNSPSSPAVEIESGVAEGSNGSEVENDESSDSSPAKRWQQDNSLKDVISSSKVSEQWSAFLEKEMQVYIETLQLFSPTKGGNPEEDAHYEGVVPSFQLQDASSNLDGVDDDDSDDEEDDVENNGAAGGEDLFANFEAGSDKPTPPDAATDKSDPFAGEDPFADGDPFADVASPPDVPSPETAAAEPDPFAGVSSFDLETLKDMPETGGSGSPTKEGEGESAGDDQVASTTDDKE